MSETTKSKTIKKGFKRIPKTNLAINKIGTVHNTKTRHVRTPKNVITPQYGRITTEKAVLWMFSKEKPRNGKIVHLDGNKSNRSLENIKYATPLQYITDENINISDLKTALRCYFSLDRNHKPRTNQIQTKFYLKEIVETRAFDKENENKEFHGVFRDWLTNDEITTAKVAQMHSISHKGAKNVINQHINRLTAEICKDLKAGLLKKQPFLLTQREKRKEETRTLHEFGIKRPAPFRIPTDIKAKFEKLGIKHPTVTEINKLGSLSTSSKMIAWLGLAEKCLIGAPIEFNKTKIKERAELKEMIKLRKYDFYNDNPDETL